METKENNQFESVIMFADIKNSTAFAFTSPNAYDELIKEFQNTTKKTVDKFCIDSKLDKSCLYVYGQGDEVMIIIYNIDMELAATLALELSIYLKLAWMSNEYIMKKGEAFLNIDESNPPIDLRIGIHAGKVTKIKSPWTNNDSFIGVAINLAKRIESAAEEAKETLIMVSMDIKNLYKTDSSKIKFDDPISLNSLNLKGLSKHFSIWVYPIKKFTDSYKISKKIVPQKSNYTVLDYMNIGYAKALAGNYKDAIDEYDYALKLNPKFAPAYNNRGNAKNKIGDVRGAIIDYDEAIELDSAFAMSYNNRAFAKTKIGDMEGAIKDYYEVIKYRAKDPGAYNDLALVFFRFRKYDDAIINFKKAIEHSSKNAKSFFYNNCGYTYFEKGDYDNAKEAFIKAVELDEKLATAWCGLGITYYRMGIIDLALKNYSHAIEIDIRFKGKFDELMNAGLYYSDFQIETMNKIVKEIK